MQLTILMKLQQKVVDWEWYNPKIGKREKKNWNPKIGDFNFNYESKNQDQDFNTFKRNQDLEDDDLNARINRNTMRNWTRKNQRIPDWNDLWTSSCSDTILNFIQAPKDSSMEKCKHTEREIEQHKTCEKWINWISLSYSVLYIVRTEYPTNYPIRNVNV